MNKMAIQIVFQSSEAVNIINCGIYRESESSTVKKKYYINHKIKIKLPLLFDKDPFLHKHPKRPKHDMAVQLFPPFLNL